MNYKMIKSFAITVGLFLSAQQSLYSQDTLGILSLFIPVKIDYQKPDETFILREDSLTYYSDTHQASISYMILPSS